PPVRGRGQDPDSAPPPASARRVHAGSVADPTGYDPDPSAEPARPLGQHVRAASTSGSPSRQPAREPQAPAASARRGHVPSEVRLHTTRAAPNRTPWLLSILR